MGTKETPIHGQELNHKNAADTIDLHFVNGNVDGLIKDHEKHPSGFERYWEVVCGVAGPLLKKDKRLLAGGALALGGGIVFAGIKLHEASVEHAKERFIGIFNDPLSDEATRKGARFKEVRRAARTAIKEGFLEEFVEKLCNSSVIHPENAKKFWSDLNPYGDFINALLEEDTRTPNSPNPEFQPKYKERIEKMENDLGRDPDEDPDILKVQRDGKIIMVPKGESKSTDTIIWMPGTHVKKALDAKMQRRRNAAKPTFSLQRS